MLPGFTLADIPKQWEAVWPFWCDKVQPAVRQTTGCDTDARALVVEMSGASASV
jgi:hypothetical protein